MLYTKFKAGEAIFGTACNIFHLYAKKFAFTEFDRYMTSALAFFIASKIEYYPIRYFDIIEFYYNNKKGPKGK